MLFTGLFPKAATKFINIVLSSTYTVLPTSFTTSLESVPFSLKNFATIFSTLIIVQFFSLALYIIEQVTQGNKLIVISPENEKETDNSTTGIFSFFFSINSVIFLLFLITNKVSLHIDLFQLFNDLSQKNLFINNLHFVLFYFSFAIFLLLFSMAYLPSLWTIPPFIIHHPTMNPLLKGVFFIAYISLASTLITLLLT